MSATIDASELRAFAAKLQAQPDKARKQVGQVVSRGALAIKKQMQSEANRSRHFRIARAINYDRHVRTGDVEAEIGPTKGSPGSLANLAYFGGAHGGGGTIPDPKGALDAETPKFLKALEDMASDL